jgi:Phage tail lysozyme/LysM domain
MKWVKQGYQIRSVCMSPPPVDGVSNRITVQSGDTLSEIARENGVTLEELLEANPQFDASKVDGKLEPTTGNSRDPDLILPGETIVLPPNASNRAGSPDGGYTAMGPNGPNPNGAGPTASVGNPTTKSGKVAEAMRYFQSQGWSKEQAAGIVANLQAESGLNPSIVGDGGAAYGIGQWHPDRQANFARFAGHSIRNSTFAEQLQFVQWELTHTESRAGNALKGADSASEAAAIFCRLYERPADIPGQSAYRGRLANQIMGG